MSMHITTQNFESQVLKAQKPVLVDFYAVWCGPCKMLAPVLEELENSRDDILIGKVNVDEEPALLRQFSITAVPTLVLFKDGKSVKQITGFQSREALEQLVNGV